MKSIKSSFFGRAPKLLKASMKLATGRDIESVVQSLSELKGVPQKIGQLLSMDVTQYISSELKDKLKPLQGEGQALHHEIMLAVLKKQMSAELFGEISEFSLEAIGAGSIGQVHRASVRNRQVVFKIQYPDIEKTVHSDMAILNPASTLYEMFRPAAKDLSILLKEAKAMLLNEINYQREMDNQYFFRNILADDDRFWVPEVLSEFSSGKIICMEYIEGMSLTHFFKQRQDEVLKNKISNALLDLFIDEFFIYGKVQTDPNFANYLIGPEGQVVLLDFGAVKEFDQEFRTKYFQLLKASYDQDDYKIMLYGEQLGLVDRSDRKEAVVLFISFMKNVLSYFHQDKNPVDFTKEEITKGLLETGWKLWKEQRISSPDSNLVFLHRKLGGLFSLLKEMESKIDLYPFWQKILDVNKQ